MKRFAVLTAVLFVIGISNATLVEVGNGDNSANVSIEWSDGFVADFIVNFTPTVVSGYDLMETINADLSGMTMSFDNYGSEGSPSWFLNGVTYAGHSDIGYAGGENWWHQWVKSGADDWAFGSGMSGTVIHDGDSQGFVYGRAGAPVPEPATMTLLAAGLLLACRRK